MDDLRTLIDRRGWTQSQTAAALGVTRGAVAKWLSDDRKPDGRSRRLIRAYLVRPDLDPAELDDPTAT